jgi:hypothetical protein
VIPTDIKIHVTGAECEIIRSPEHYKQLLTTDFSRKLFMKKFFFLVKTDTTFQKALQ